MRYGEDVISRIAHAAQHNETALLAAAVREGINTNLKALYERQDVHPNHVCDMTVVGNTAMHHLALGLSPVGLGQAPFAPAAAEPITLKASELGIHMNPDGGVHFPPPIAGFVGSDALAVVAATHLVDKKKPSMAIDIGTNTEIALAHDGRVTVTSCASGPAFEGYQIRNGMKAVAGAIERVKIDEDGEPVEIVTITGAEPIGICGSGVVDLLAGLVHAGVVDKSGRMNAEHPRVRKGEEGWEYLLTEGPHGDIVFTQHDVRSLQLAKGAIHAGLGAAHGEPRRGHRGPRHRVHRRRVRQLPGPGRGAVPRPLPAGRDRARRVRRQRRRRRRADGAHRREGEAPHGQGERQHRVPRPRHGQALPGRLLEAIGVRSRLTDEGTSTRAAPGDAALTGADHRLRGYAEIAASSLILGTSATLIQISTMPASLLLVLRMGLAGIALAVLFFLTGGVEEVRRSGRLRRIVLLGFVVALEMIFYFASIRASNVTVGVSLEYMAPVWVALLAPLLLRTRRRRIDMIAVAVAVGGMAVLVLPAATAGDGDVTLAGVVFGLLGGLMFAAAMMLVSSMSDAGVRGSTFALFYCVGTVVLFTPLAVWQTAASHYSPTWADVWIVVVSGLVYTALCFSLFTDGLRYVRVEHAGILGYLEPVTAPLWAFVLIGEAPPWTTYAGGALIVAAGILVIVFGKGEAEPLLEPLT